MFILFIFLKSTSVCICSEISSQKNVNCVVHNQEKRKTENFQQSPELKWKKKKTFSSLRRVIRSGISYKA